MKYNILPLTAIGWYDLLSLLIVLAVTSADDNCSLILADWIFDSSNLLTNISLSNISLPASLTKFYILASKSLIIFLPLLILNIVWSFCSSNSGFSCFTTSTNNWSSNPFLVTVKLINVTFIDNSGK